MGFAVGGIIDAIATTAATVGGAIAPEAAAATAAIAPEAAAATGTLLPEILVTPEVAGGVAAGTELGATIGPGLAAGAGELGAAGAAATGAATAGLGAGAADLGITAADLAAAGGGPGAVGGGMFGGEARAAPTAAPPTGGVTTVPETFGGAPGAPAAGGLPAAGSAISPTEALSGTTGPLASLDTGTAPSSFDQLWAQTGGQFPTPAADITEPGAALALQEPGAPAAGLPSEITAGTSAAFPPATAAQPGVVPADVATALTEGGGEFPPSEASLPGSTATETAMNAPITPAGGAPGAVAPTIGPGGVAAAPPAGAPLNIAPTTGAAGGGITGTVASVLASPWTKAAEIAAPLGALGLTLARGQPSLPPAMQTALNNLGPAENLASQQLTAAAANQITPAQAQQIQTWKQQQLNQLYQFYASSGRDPNQDTDYLQGVQNIESQALAMQQGFINSMITNGLAAQGTVDSTLQAAANLQVQQDQAFQQSIAGALQSFGLVAAISSVGGGNRPAQATQTT